MQKLTVYLNGSKDQMGGYVYTGELTHTVLNTIELDDDALSLWLHALTEVAFDLEVNDDGSYRIVEIREGKDRFIPAKSAIVVDVNSQEGP